MKTIRDISDADISGKKVFLRADFDVPVANGSLIEPFRIERQKENLHYLLDRGASVVLAAHISAISSFEPIVSQLSALLGAPIEWKSGSGNVVLLENLRANVGETANDEAFARQMLAGCDLYVNNAFAVCHRTHASVVAAAHLIPAYAGLLIVEETQNLQRVIDAPADGKIIFIGGAKASTKIPVIEHLIDKAQAIAVGGVVANDILKARGVDVGASLADREAAYLLAGLDLSDSRLHVPGDYVRENGQIFDIGPLSIERYAELARGAKLIVWNGPMGKFEDERYATGTRAVAEAMASSGAFSVVGGGDTINAIDHFGLLDRFSFVSTGGGAMLAFLAGESLPGLDALGYSPR